LQNVHFPEKQHLFAMSQMNQQQQKFPSLNFQSASYAHLLPPNMSFYDVASQTKEYQYHWFMKLSETYGLEEADKFTELLRQVPMMNNKPFASNHVDALFNGMGDSSKNYMHLMDFHQQQQQHLKPDNKMENLLKIQQSGSFNEAIANKLFQSDELDSIFMSSIQQNQKMVEGNLLGSLAKEMEMKHAAEQSFQHPSSNLNFSDLNILNGIDLFNMTTAKPLELEFEPNVESPQRSIPLYMRKTQNRNFE
jgi:hypothetical protein